MNKSPLTLLLVAGLLVAACGDDDDDAASATTDAPATTSAAAATTATTEAPATTATTEAPATTAGAPATTAAGGDDQAIVEAFAAVFDSTVPFEEKAPNLENAESLRTAAEAYAAAGSAMGGITLDPTSVVVNGGEATVTYDVLFGGAPAYQDLTKTITKVDDVWVVPQAAFCEFLTSARVPCL